MLRSISRFLSATLLFLFLFPQVHKGLHDFEHRNDFHCDSHAEKHFHTLEHYCNICDFSISGGIETEICDYNFTDVVHEIAFSTGNTQCISASFWRSLPARAPPVLLS